MNPFRLGLFVAVAVCLIIVVTVGCGGGGGGSDEILWSLYAISLSFDGPKDTGLGQAGFSSLIELYSDGTCYFHMAAPQEEILFQGTWGETGDRYIIADPSSTTKTFYKYAGDIYAVFVVSGVGDVWLWYERI